MLPFFPSIGKWILGKLSPRNLLYLAGALVFAYGAYTVYNHIFQRGVDSQIKVIKNLTIARDAALADAKQAHADLTSYKDQYAAWKSAERENDAKLKEEQAKVVADLTTQLNNYSQRLSQADKVKHDLSKYISKANDAGCIIPLGFMQLYNRSLEGGTGSGLLSLSSGSLAYAPTGLSLTDVADTFLDNNLAARRNRDLVLAWQSWFRSNEALFKKYKATPPPEPFVK